MKFHLLLFLFLANVFKVNSSCKIEIQSLLNKADKEFREIRYLESLKSANKALAISKKNQISQGITDANISVAKALLEIGVYKQGLNYLIDAEKQPYFKTSIHYTIEVARLRGRAYANLKIYKLSLQEFQKQLTFSKKLDDKQERYRYIFLAHQNLSVLFQRQNQMDSLQKHLALQESLLKEFNEKQASIMLSTTYVQKAEERILNKDYKKRAYI
ncbi:hypothetical protein [Chryseobacterium sp. Mn2064]|uniref:hypothetical protein n=1 Tax=Chryseobacterium sp. Mn2064 TaxID=3395263 RepID=UPI003BE85E89